MYSENLLCTGAINSKLEQLKTVGLTFEELQNAQEILMSAECSVYMQNLQANSQTDLGQNNLKGFQNWSAENSATLFAGDSYEAQLATLYASYFNYLNSVSQACQFDSYAQIENEILGYNGVGTPSSYVNYNSTNSFLRNQENEVHDSTDSTRIKSVSSTVEDLKQTSKSQKCLPIMEKIRLMEQMLEEIDDSKVIITGKPKNKAQKIKTSNRHSQYRGVSLNGKKYQVMIIGSIKKKYFGGFSCEKDAAILYDKLSILTNGLAAKTNFSYTKSELLCMIPELERMEPIVSN